MKRKLPSKPPELPEVYMLFYRRVVPVTYAEEHARHMMRGFDYLPERTRFAVNCAPEWPNKAATLADRFGDDGAANRIIKANWDFVFKTRDGTGVHP